MMQRNIVFVSIALLGAGVLSAGPAGAAGCNGVVDQFKWGCAAWDNNNGPQFPHYKAPRQNSQPAHRPAPVVQQAPRPTIAPNSSAGMVAAGAGNAQQRAQSGMVAAGAGNAVNKSGMVAAGAGN